MKIRKIFLGVALVAAAGSSFSLSLGRVRGSAVLGQPLSLAFELKTETGEDFDPACLDVQVFQGDTRIEGSRITLSTTGTGADRVLRLKSNVVVDEPAVTVNLRAGCDLKTARRYVLLTDLPQDGSASQLSAEAPLVRAPLVAAAGSAAPAATAPTAAATAPRREGKPVEPREANRARERRTDLPAAAPTAAGPRQAKETPAQASASKARLKLEAPLTAGVDHPTTLRLSPSLAVVPQEGSSPQRLESLAAWNALSRSLEQVLADADKRSVLEAENKRLKAASLAAQGQVNELQVRLAEAEDARYANPLVYGLSAALVLLLGAMAYAWTRKSKLPAKAAGAEPAPAPKKKGKLPWWQTGLKGGATAATAAAPVSQLPPQAEAGPSEFPKSTLDRPAFGPSLSGVHVDLDLSESAFRRLEGMGASPTQDSTFAASVAPVSKLPDPVAAASAPTQGGKAPMDLFDVQQHAEFFVSLGQYDEAIEVLQKHIDQFPEATPLAYLDLLKIHHMLSRTGEYAHWRERFNAVFSAEVPPFSAFGKGGKSLESYPRTLSYLEKVWGSPRALVAVEDSLFRAHAVSIGEFFDLEAFKDLLVLQAVARQLAQDATVQGSSAIESRLQAGDLSMAFQSSRDVHASTTPAQLPEAFMPVEPISGFGPSTQMPGAESLLDLDLSELVVEQAPQPVSPLEAPLQTPPKPPVHLDLEMDSLLTAPKAEAVPALPELVSPLDSPLDFVLDANSMASPLDVGLSLLPEEPLPSSKLDDSHLIDFDMFEADLLKAQEKSRGAKDPKA